jgi:riboflavin kinase
MGWALIEGSSNAASGRGVPQKAAVNVGYSPTFEGQENKEKIVEAHLILDDPIPDFYDEVMRLLLIGFLRPEEKFGSFPELVAAITNDVETSRALLDEDSYSSFQSDALFRSTEAWIGKDGGDSKASWEFQDWDKATNN